MGPEPPQQKCLHVIAEEQMLVCLPWPLSLTGLPARPRHCRPMAARRWTSCSARRHRRGAHPTCACCRLCTAASCELRPTPAAPAASCSAHGAMPVWMSRRGVSARWCQEHEGIRNRHFSLGEQIEDAPEGSLYPSCRDVGNDTSLRHLLLLLCTRARCTRFA
jgi:hypothetical protein